MGSGRRTDGQNRLRIGVTPDFSFSDVEHLDSATRYVNCNINKHDRISTAYFIKKKACDRTVSL
jgi:hypothetical protein